MNRSTAQTILDILSATELFFDLTDHQLEQIAGICELVTLQEGDLLFEENTASDEMYIIGRGLVDILIDPSLVSQQTDLDMVSIAQLRQGDILGEMALVDQGLRSASGRITVDETVLLRIPRDPLINLCRANPELGFVLMHNLAADLALKIRNTDLTLRQYQLQLMYRPLDE